MLAVAARTFSGVGHTQAGREAGSAVAMTCKGTFEARRRDIAVINRYLDTPEGRVRASRVGQPEQDIKKQNLQRLTVLQVVNQNAMGAGEPLEM